MECEQILQERAHRQQPDLRRLIAMLERQQDIRIARELADAEMVKRSSQFQVA